MQALAPICTACRTRLVYQEGDLWCPKCKVIRVRIEKGTD